LGRLGDPRFAGPYLLPDFVTIPAGVFWMGSDEAEVARLKKEADQSAEDEAPRHQVDLDAFAIARYPTTNAMFRCFWAAGGYADRRWWAEAIADKRWAKGKVNDWQGERDQPAWWDDARFDGPTQPVVGVTWYEAAAYCRWLTATLNDGHIYRLPTEAEWERAARGPGNGHRYPWSGVLSLSKGDDWADDRCNSEELKLGRTTPVGVFPAGASAEGVLDLSGNAWEWCRDWYDAKAYAERAGRVTRNPTGAERGNTRVLRGGSWRDDRTYVRCAFRGRYYPVGRNDDYGFRVARGSP
jgi:formylglycine-generating enzyme required for sulfatase activity